MKTKKAYKLFRLKNGRLFPLFVLADEPLPMGVWIQAKDGPRTADGHVKSKLGPLAYRPGFHMNDSTAVGHIGVTGTSGKIEYMKPGTIWTECEYIDEIDYQPEADGRGWNGSRVVPVKAMLDHIPVNGSYRYKTNPQMIGTWIIAGNIRINRILSDREAETICRDAGYEPLKRLPDDPARDRKESL